MTHVAAQIPHRVGVGARSAFTVVEPRLGAGMAAPDGVGAMLCRLNASQWLVLIYPMFLFLVHRRRDESDVAVVDPSAVLQVALTALCGAWVLYRTLQSLHGFERIILGTPLRWIAAYGLLAVLSASWSSIPSLTVFRGVQLLIYLMLVVDAMATLRNAQEMIRFQLFYAVAIILFWHVPRLRYGLSLSSLHTSDVAGAIVASAFVGWLARGRQWRLLHLAVVGSIVLSTSTGTFFACTGAAIVMLLLMRGRAAGLGMLLLCAAMLAVFILPEQVGSVVFFGKNEGTIASGTGRVPIWQWVLQERVTTAPVLGFGFGDGEVQARLYNIGGFRMMHMHNAFMSAIVNLGMVGVMLWAVMWAGMLHAAWRLREPRLRLVLLGTCVAVFLNTISMESVTAPLSMPWIAHAMFYTFLATRRG